MHTKIGRGLAAGAIAAAIAAFAPRVAVGEDIPQVIQADSVKKVATVEAVDVANRIVTLKDENGVVSEFQVGDEVKNLAQVKKGDRVEAIYREAIAYQVFKAGTAVPSSSESVTGDRAKLGDKPAADVTNVQTVTATIKAIDKEANTVTLEGPSGRQITAKVRDPKKLDTVSVGDLVQLTYTRAFAIAVKPAAK